MCVLFFVGQIEALKAAGVSEVILAINYQPEVFSVNPKVDNDVPFASYHFTF